MSYIYSMVFIWRTPGFGGQFLDPYLKDTDFGASDLSISIPQVTSLISSFFPFKTLNPDATFLQLLQTYAQPLVDVQDNLVLIQSVFDLLTQAQTVPDSIYPVGSEEAPEDHRLVLFYINPIKAMNVGDTLFFKGVIASSTSHAIMYVVERNTEDLYSFILVNTGYGVEYHPTKTNEEGKEVKLCAFPVRNLFLEKITDLFFWKTLISLGGQNPICRKSQMYTASTLYNLVLPILTMPQTPFVFPASSDIEDVDAYKSEQLSGTCTYKSIVSTMRYYFHQKGMSRLHQKLFMNVLRTLYLIQVDKQFNKPRYFDQILNTWNESDQEIINRACISYQSALSKYQSHFDSTALVNEIVPKIFGKASMYSKLVFRKVRNIQFSPTQGLPTEFPNFGLLAGKEPPVEKRGEPITLTQTSSYLNRFNFSKEITTLSKLLKKMSQVFEILTQIVTEEPNKHVTFIRCSAFLQVVIPTFPLRDNWETDPLLDDVSNCEKLIEIACALIKWCMISGFCLSHASKHHKDNMRVLAYGLFMIIEVVFSHISHPILKGHRLSLLFYAQSFCITDPTLLRYHHSVVALDLNWRRKFPKNLFELVNLPSQSFEFALTGRCQNRLIKYTTEILNIHDKTDMEKLKAFCNDWEPVYPVFRRVQSAVWYVAMFGYHYNLQMRIDRLEESLRQWNSLDVTTSAQATNREIRIKGNNIRENSKLRVRAKSPLPLSIDYADPQWYKEALLVPDQKISSDLSNTFSSEEDLIEFLGYNTLSLLRLPLLLEFFSFHDRFLLVSNSVLQLHLENALFSQMDPFDTRIVSDKLLDLKTTEFSIPTAYYTVPTQKGYLFDTLTVMPQRIFDPLNLILQCLLQNPQVKDDVLLFWMCFAQRIIDFWTTFTASNESLTSEVSKSLLDLTARFVGTPATIEKHYAISQMRHPRNMWDAVVSSFWLVETQTLTGHLKPELGTPCLYGVYLRHYQNQAKIIDAIKQEVVNESVFYPSSPKLTYILNQISNSRSSTIQSFGHFHTFEYHEQFYIPKGVNAEYAQTVFETNHPYTPGSSLTTVVDFDKETEYFHITFDHRCSTLAGDTLSINNKNLISGKRGAWPQNAVLRKNKPTLLKFHTEEPTSDWGLKIEFAARLNTSYIQELAQKHEVSAATASRALFKCQGRLSQADALLENSKVEISLEAETLKQQNDRLFKLFVGLFHRPLESDLWIDVLSLDKRTSRTNKAAFPSVLETQFGVKLSELQDLRTSYRSFSGQDSKGREYTLAQWVASERKTYRQQPISYLKDIDLGPVYLNEDEISFEDVIYQKTDLPYQKFGDFWYEYLARMIQEHSSPFFVFQRDNHYLIWTAIQFAWTSENQKVSSWIELIDYDTLYTVSFLSIWNQSYQRRMVFTSNENLSLHDCIEAEKTLSHYQSVLPRQYQPTLESFYSRGSLASAHGDTHFVTHSDIYVESVISREFVQNKDVQCWETEKVRAFETQVPGHLLKGLIPAVLTEIYDFWKVKSTILYGYPRASGLKSQLRIKIDPAKKTATIIRSSLECNETLIHPFSVPANIMNVFVQFTSLSSICFWQMGEDDTRLRVEIPKLQLHFKESKKYQGFLKCLEYPGFFVNTNDYRRLNIFDWLPFYLVLMDLSGRAILLVPYVTPAKKTVDRCPFATRIIRDHFQWTDLTYFQCQIDAAGMFLTPQNEIAHLYLILIALHKRKYEMAISLLTRFGMNFEAKSTILMSIRDKIETLRLESHPNSLAFFVFWQYFNTTVAYGWDSPIYKYCQIVRYVDANCRVPEYIERSLLDAYVHKEVVPIIVRKAYWDDSISVLQLSRFQQYPFAEVVQVVQKLQLAIPSKENTDQLLLVPLTLNGLLGRGSVLRLVELIVRNALNPIIPFFLGLVLMSKTSELSKSIAALLLKNVPFENNPYDDSVLNVRVYLRQLQQNSVDFYVSSLPNADPMLSYATHPYSFNLRNDDIPLLQSPVDVYDISRYFEIPEGQDQSAHPIFQLYENPFGALSAELPRYLSEEVDSPSSRRSYSVIQENVSSVFGSQDESRKNRLMDDLSYSASESNVAYHVLDTYLIEIYTKLVNTKAEFQEKIQELKNALGASDDYHTFLFAYLTNKHVATYIVTQILVYTTSITIIHRCLDQIRKAKKQKDASQLATLTALGQLLTTKRNGQQFDASILLFEYQTGIILRAEQRNKLEHLYQYSTEGKSGNFQFIMGSGKTTVFTPLLALKLLLGKEIIPYIAVPDALLEQTVSILRQTFTQIIPIPLMVYSVQREEVLPALSQALQIGSRSFKGVICTTPLSLKSTYLNMVSYYQSNNQVERSHHDVVYSSLFEQWKTRSYLILDEVDLSLDPLTSELNFPITSPELVDPSEFRWRLGIFFIDLVFYPKVVAMQTRILQIEEIIENSWISLLEAAVRNNNVLTQPHSLLINPIWYHDEARPILAHLALLRIGADYSESYMNVIMNATPYEGGDDGLKLKLFLIRDWVNSIIPHCWSKTYRVHMGLKENEKFAVPYIGKDRPAYNSQFSHPDVLTAMSVISFKLHGLRFEDTMEFLTTLQKRIRGEKGRIVDRPTQRLFLSLFKNGDDPPISNLIDLQLSDLALVKKIHNLIRNDAVDHFFSSHLFPQYFKFTTTKISCTGTDLVTFLFPRTMGFSGTPPAIVPASMGEENTKYDPGVEASVYLNIVEEAVTQVAINSVDPVTFFVRLTIQYHNLTALVDAGAVFSDMENEEVAIKLAVANPQKPGCIFFDKITDRKMFADVNGVITPYESRSSVIDSSVVYFDHIHTTGIDVLLPLNAKALVTTGSGLTYDRFSQALYRMRQIGKGQTALVLISHEWHQQMVERFPFFAESHNLLLISWLFGNSLAYETLQRSHLKVQELESRIRKYYHDSYHPPDVVTFRGIEKTNRFDPTSQSLFEETLELMRSLGLSMPEDISDSLFLSLELSATVTSSTTQETIQFVAEDSEQQQQQQQQQQQISASSVPYISTSRVSWSLRTIFDTRSPAPEWSPLPSLFEGAYPDVAKFFTTSPTPIYATPLLCGSYSEEQSPKLFPAYFFLNFGTRDNVAFTLYLSLAEAETVIYYWYKKGLSISSNNFINSLVYERNEHAHFLTPGYSNTERNTFFRLYSGKLDMPLLNQVLLAEYPDQRKSLLDCLKKQHDIRYHSAASPFTEIPNLKFLNDYPLEPIPSQEKAALFAWKERFPMSAWQPQLTFHLLPGQPISFATQLSDERVRTAEDSEEGGQVFVSLYFSEGYGTISYFDLLWNLEQEMKLSSGAVTGRQATPVLKTKENRVDLPKVSYKEFKGRNDYLLTRVFGIKGNVVIDNNTVEVMDYANFGIIPFNSDTHSVFELHIMKAPYRLLFQTWGRLYEVPQLEGEIVRFLLDTTQKIVYIYCDNFTSPEHKEALFGVDDPEIVEQLFPASYSAVSNLSFVAIGQSTLHFNFGTTPFYYPQPETDSYCHFEKHDFFFSGAEAKNMVVHIGPYIWVIRQQIVTHLTGGKIYKLKNTSENLLSYIWGFNRLFITTNFTLALPPLNTQIALPTIEYSRNRNHPAATRFDKLSKKFEKEDYFKWYQMLCTFYPYLPLPYDPDWVDETPAVVALEFQQQSGLLLGNIAISTDTERPLICTGNASSTFDSRKIENPDEASFHFEVQPLVLPYPESKILAGWVPSRMRFNPPFSELREISDETAKRYDIQSLHIVEGAWDLDDSSDNERLVPIVVLLNHAVAVIKVFPIDITE